MNAISRISTAKVDTLLSTLSSTPTLANRWYKIGKEAARAGTLPCLSIISISVFTKEKDHPQASNLGHDREERNSTYESALATHVAAGNNLESRLLSRIDIVRDKFCLHDILTDRMTSVFETQSVTDPRSNCALLEVYFRIHRTVP